MGIEGQILPVLISCATGTVRVRQGGRMGSLSMCEAINDERDSVCEK